MFLSLPPASAGFLVGLLFHPEGGNVSPNAGFSMMLQPSKEEYTLHFYIYLLFI
jgi:hypothetical protein